MTSLSESIRITVTVIQLYDKRLIDEYCGWLVLQIIHLQLHVGCCVGQCWLPTALMEPRPPEQAH